MFFKKPAPLFVKSKPVCLNRINHTNSSSVEPLLNPDHFSEKIQSPEGWFPSLEGKTYLIPSLSHSLFYEIFYSIHGHHSADAFFTFVHLVAVKAITATHIAQSGSRFDQYRMKQHSLTSGFIIPFPAYLRQVPARTPASLFRFPAQQYFAAESFQSDFSG